MIFTNNKEGFRGIRATKYKNMCWENILTRACWPKSTEIDDTSQKMAQLKYEILNQKKQLLFKRFVYQVESSALLITDLKKRNERLGNSVVRPGKHTSVTFCAVIVFMQGGRRLFMSHT